MSSLPAKIIINVESPIEQQENLKNNRKNLKVIQKTARDKENLVGRVSLLQKAAFIKSKSETEIPGEITEKKRKCMLSTTTTSCQTDPDPNLLAQITEEDLTSIDEPREFYWKTLAERRRIALDISLKENEHLHERIIVLEEELTTSRTMLDETKNLVEVLTELLDDNNDSGNCSKDLLSSTLLDDSSLHVDAAVPHKKQMNETVDDLSDSD